MLDTKVSMNKISTRTHNTNVSLLFISIAGGFEEHAVEIILISRPFPDFSSNE
jgi:hypothetical protein